MLLSCAVGAVIFVGQRYGVQHSSPVAFFTMTMGVDIAVFSALAFIRKSPLLLTAITPRLLAVLFSTGVAWSIGLTCLYASYNYTLALYAGSVMQVQILISITLGALLFKEKHYLKRLLAGLLMVCGVILVSWGAR
jgi:drug/metabolite transporter (DMT)-like permease